MRGVTAMAETKRMTVEQVVSYLLEEDGLDFLRESLWRPPAFVDTVVR
jgi:hypothetical protein